MRFTHTAINVRDLDESMKFYAEALGLTPGTRRRIPENHAEIGFLTEPTTGVRIELTRWENKGPPASGEELDHIGFEVPDLDAALARARAAGAKVQKEPFTLSGGSHRIAFVTDPNEIWIELVERPEDRGSS
ncbi:MAG: VOC family protein [Thermoplasmata archaeon]